MNKLNLIAHAFAIAIHDKCYSLTLQSFSDTDFISIKDAYTDIADAQNNNYPIKYINRELYVLKRTKQEEYDKKYTEILEDIINKIIKGDSKWTSII